MDIQDSRAVGAHSRQRTGCTGAFGARLRQLFLAAACRLRYARVIVAIAMSLVLTSAFGAEPGVYVYNGLLRHPTISYYQFPWASKTLPPNGPVFLTDSHVGTDPDGFGYDGNTVSTRLISPTGQVTTQQQLRFYLGCWRTVPGGTALGCEPVGSTGTGAWFGTNGYVSLGEPVP